MTLDTGFVALSFAYSSGGIAPDGREKGNFGGAKRSTDYTSLILAAPHTVYSDGSAWGHLPASVDKLQRWFRATMADRAGITDLDLADRQTDTHVGEQSCSI